MKVELPIRELQTRKLSYIWNAESLSLIILFYKSQVLNYFNWILNHLYLVFKVLLRKNKCFHFSEINNEAEDSNYFY